MKRQKIYKYLQCIMTHLLLSICHEFCWLTEVSKRNKANIYNEIIVFMYLYLCLCLYVQASALDACNHVSVLAKM